jgi:hypothetical protein
LDINVAITGTTSCDTPSSGEIAPTRLINVILLSTLVVLALLNRPNNSPATAFLLSALSHRASNADNNVLDLFLVSWDDDLAVAMTAGKIAFGASVERSS